MRKVKDNNSVRVIFSSIHEVVKYNREKERTDYYFKNHHESDMTDSFHVDFTGTSNYAESETLLLQGWECMAKELKSKIGANMRVLGHKNKPSYSVQGFQACVPRYLQGMPDDMIYYKQVPVKNKVITIIKDIGYSSVTKKETIIEESIKMLQLVRNMEQQGYRTNLYISYAIRGTSYEEKNKLFVIQIKIKDASQRLNLKQVAFPLVHPSMLRRIIFGIEERVEEFSHITRGYGYCTEYEETKHIYKDCYYIPRIVKDKEIIDIEQYRV